MFSLAKYKTRIYYEMVKTYRDKEKVRFSKSCSMTYTTQFSWRRSPCKLWTLLYRAVPSHQSPPFVCILIWSRCKQMLQADPETCYNIFLLLDISLNIYNHSYEHGNEMHSAPLFFHNQQLWFHLNFWVNYSMKIPHSSLIFSYLLNLTSFFIIFFHKAFHSSLFPPVVIH